MRCGVTLAQGRDEPGGIVGLVRRLVAVRLSGAWIATVIEVKAHVGSFGNNFNNRVEEALGNATDFWSAYREATFAPSARPWLGYLMMLEHRATTRVCKASITSPTRS
jgi:hypothetical protein